MWHDLKIKHLVALRTVSEERTFGRAATRLGYSQSAVSQQISSLEQLTGHTLLDRPAGPRHPRLTPAGERLLEHCEAILDSVATAEVELERLATGVTGNLTIGTIQSITARVLPFTLQQLHDETPNVEITAVEEDGDADFFEQRLLRGELDLAFVVGEVGSSLASQHLGADPHVAIVQANEPAGPIHLADLNKRPMIGQPAEDSCGLLVDRGLERLGVTPRYAFRSHDNGAIQAMVAAGIGVAIVPLLTVDPSGPATSIRRTQPELEPRQLSIAWDPLRTLPPVASRFIEIVAQVCAHQLAELTM